MANETKIVFFCANDQQDTEHTLDIDGNSEIVLTCGCGRFIKLPAGTTPDGVKEYAIKHKTANEGQVSVASLEAKKAELLKGFEGGV